MKISRRDALLQLLLLPLLIFGNAPFLEKVRGLLATKQRLQPPKFRGEVSQLRTWRMDIRQVLAANSLRDAHREWEAKMLQRFNEAVMADEVIPFRFSYEDQPS